MAQDKFIAYLNRSAEQIIKDLADKFPVYLPEITDIENDSLFEGMKIWAGILENLHYYLDRRAQETFLATCKRFASAVKIAEANDYRIKSVYPASADISFYFQNPVSEEVLIEKGSIVATVEGTPFITMENATIYAGESETIVAAMQYEKVENVAIGTSNGQASQTFFLPEKVVDFDIRLNVAGNLYGQVDTFFYSGPEDYHFVASINEQREMSITFGDGITGKIPPIGETIFATYYLSEGLKGNVGIGKITEIISSIPVPAGTILKCTNKSRAAGGVNEENLEDLRKRIPLSRYTLRRAVTKQDYIDLAELYPGVQRAGLESNCQSIYLYIAPAGGGVASTALLEALSNWFFDKKTIGHKLSILAAGEIRIRMIVEVQALPNYVNATVASEVKTRLLAFGSAENQEIGGEVQIGDLYEIIETTPGVRYSKISNISPIPYAKPLTGKVLSWQVSINEGSMEVHRWKIIFASSTQFQLIKNNSFFGIYAVGESISIVEMTLKVFASAYVSGDAWEFITYKYNGSVVLEEQSLPVFLEDDLTINVKGGV